MLMLSQSIVTIYSCSANEQKQYAHVKLMRTNKQYEYIEHTHSDIFNRISGEFEFIFIYKTVSVHYKNIDLILKMIKKAKISRVRVPLSTVNILHQCSRYLYEARILSQFYIRINTVYNIQMVIPVYRCKAFCLVQDGEGQIFVLISATTA